MAYSITKPNVYFSGDKRILTETVAGSVSKFNVVMTHAKDSMYYVINDSTKDTIEIAIEPFKTDTNCVLTNYIMFPNDFSSKTISFVAPDGYEIYYTGDYTRAKYTENTIIAIQHIDMGKIVVTINAGEKEYKYGILLTLETTEANETVHYLDESLVFTDINKILSNVKLYWDYDPVTDSMGQATHNNSKTYETPGTHYLVVLSDDNLQFPNHAKLYTGTQEGDISLNLTKIDKFRECEAKLIYKDYSPSQGYTDVNAGNYFWKFGRLAEINIDEVFDSSITDFSSCFSFCRALTTIPNDLFAANTAATSFNCCFNYCSSLTSIPEGLFNGITNCTNFGYCFASCTALTTLPSNLFNGIITMKTYFNGCFSGCPALTTLPSNLFNNIANADFTWCFSNCTGLTALSSNVFNNITDGDFTWCFERCTALTSLQSNLFNNIRNANFKYCFNDCTALITLPSNLFTNITGTASFVFCFYNCTALTTLPSNLFNNITSDVDFGYFFIGCTAVRSNVPELWDTTKWPKFKDHFKCFTDCRNAPNYSSIPDDWK